ncbi:MAG: glycosyltransferase family 2 protein [Armatimonadetes bacterium]|nr:glycosyltransferase family 2 protein [Armatimonadota bacterium]
MKLSVIIPVYNECELFPILLQKVREVEVDKEIIVVDNCSTDGTRDLLRELADKATRIIFQPENFGKGMSVRTGIHHAKGEFLIVQDSDLEYDPQDYLKLLAEADPVEAPVVYGTRLSEEANNQHARNAFYFARVHLTTLFRILYGARISDVSTCYKLIRTDIARSLNLKCAGFDLDFEISAKICKGGYEIREVPIRYRPRSVAEGKKIRPRDGLVALYTLLKYRFVD